MNRVANTLVYGVCDVRNTVVRDPRYRPGSRPEAGEFADVPSHSPAFAVRKAATNRCRGHSFGVGSYSA